MLGKLNGREDDFALLVGPSERKFSYKEVQFQTFSLPVKISCPPADNLNETPAKLKIPTGRRHDQLALNASVVEG